MTARCLHCALWDAVLGHARQLGRHDETGKLFGRRREIAFALTACLADVLRTAPTRAERDAIFAELCAAVGPIVDEPIVIQPLAEMEITSWQ